MVAKKAQFYVESELIADQTICFLSHEPIPFQYVASVWEQKNQTVRKNQKNSFPVLTVAAVVSILF